jgi:hypothetical protein
VDEGEFFFVGQGVAGKQVGEIVFAVGDFDVDDVLVWDLVGFRRSRSRSGGRCR